MGVKRVIKTGRLGAALAIGALTALIVSQTAPVLAGQSVLQELMERQKGVTSVRAPFVQKKHSAMLTRPIESSGRFYFKPGVGVRWEYEDVLVVYDGSVLYAYSSEMQEADRIEGEEGFMGPLSFDLDLLSGKYDMQARREGVRIRVDLKPREALGFTDMVMYFPEGSAFPEEVTVNEETGDRSVTTFHDVEINVPLKDAMFVFTPPAGTTIRERYLE